ncbi:hypothetical protein JL09_g7026 [Pichia kudriavzevii]|uniref:Uncharacterized protein n=1 Tax=Pichia kudriavzevii TaxID=4909 RepID=A0A099NKB8_PICKU|nr:hypothetical protein JL09_g7026 [Pichia kudriavzevii]
MSQFICNPREIKVEAKLSQSREE